MSTYRFELGSGVEADEIKCPRNWVPRRGFMGSCYKFTRYLMLKWLPVVTNNYIFVTCRSPIRKWDEARQICMAYRHQDSDHADLASVSEIEEYRFIVDHLNKIDPQHRRW